ncbi:hypothetical protein SAMN06265173_11815 [Thalassovita litoralis]|jgi:hypothetical protein|uniref:Lipid A core-O-antigen ligase n=1 Tax=Thalassovita litoralis TaxID=1010611 RepID=A0A521ER28_9RHOB|nr:hypothetical protein [Thalassovita litoralis]SMO85560.1 hypothetical protein SAMN06265173_11815 [Thalassovita litoralis]
MPNGLAYLVLALSPLVCVAVFRSMPPGRALIVCFLGAYLFLPPQPTAFDFPLLPALTKESLPSLTVLLLCLAMYRDQMKLIPDSRAARALLLLFIVAPLGTTLTNLEPVFFGRIGLPGMSLKDMVSTLFRQILIIAPFLLARNFLHTRSQQRELLIAFVVAGLIYSLPMLLEVRLSPQLNIWIYGFFQHSFEQMMRDGGFRPIVFLYHGLWAAFLIMTCVVSAVILLRAEEGKHKVYALLAAAYLFAVLVLCKSLASLMYCVLLVPLVLFLPRRIQLWVALVLAVLALSYPVLKGAGLVPERQLLAQAEKISPDRAGSLRYRLQNENVLLDRAMEKPVFGWGSWGRNQILDPVTGVSKTVSDGYWVITLGMFGWAGWLSQFGLLLLPIFLLWLRFRRHGFEDASPYVTGMSLLLAVNVFDLLPNATLTPLTWLLMGSLLGYAERDEEGEAIVQKRQKAILKSVM